MKKVFVPNVPTRYDHVIQQRVPSIDISKAAEFGDIKLLSDYDPSAGKTDFKSALIDMELLNIETGTAPYVLMAGDPILISMAIHHCLERFGMVTALRWDRNNSRYEPVELVS